MKEKVLKIKLPPKYEEDVLVYEEGLDNYPDWLMCSKNGWTLREYNKLQKLIDIEQIKYKLNESLNDKEITEDEVLIVKEILENTIKEYNEM